MDQRSRRRDPEREQPPVLVKTYLSKVLYKMQRNLLAKKKRCGKIRCTKKQEDAKMLEPFYPKEYVDSTYEIDFEGWYKKGYRGVIFDVDNTLVPHGAPADDRAKQLFAQLQELGFQSVLLSNNKEPRVKSFCESVVGATYIYKAGKPKSGGYEQAMKRMGTDVHTTLFVGDQIFTDVWGANRTGIYTILVKPIHPKEEIQIVLKRYLERIVLHFYKKKGASL